MFLSLQSICTMSKRKNADPITAANGTHESDPEDQKAQSEKSKPSEKVSAFRSLAWLGRFLAI